MDALIDDYIESHIDSEPDELREIERRTNIRLINGRMCSGHLQGRILKMLVAMCRPKRVLELGTFTAYSALCIAEALDEDARLDTIEIDDELEDFIHENLASSPHGHKVSLHIGAALDVLRQLGEEPFDLIFIDADKRQYPEYYSALLPRLRPGGIMIADNTLWDGHVIRPTLHNDKQTEGIKKFNDMVAADPSVEKIIIPVRDGLTIIRKNCCNNS